MSSGSPLDSQVLTGFRASLQQQEFELRQVIDNAEKEVRALSDAGPLDSVDLSCGNFFKESMFATSAKLEGSCVSCNMPWSASEMANLASAPTAKGRLV